MIKLICDYNVELVNSINDSLTENEIVLTSTQAEEPSPTTQNQGIKLDFNGKRFLSSFKFMGLGMLGIFIITTIIIAVVTVLNKIKRK